jgi:hypothetical protein
VVGWFIGAARQTIRNKSLFIPQCYDTFRVLDWRKHNIVDSSWNVTEQGDAREGKWRENWQKEWVASTLHTTSVHGVSSITTADAHTSAASSRLNWRPRWFKRTRPFRRKTKSGFCACAITFQLASTECFNKLCQFSWTCFLVKVGGPQ